MDSNTKINEIYKLKNSISSKNLDLESAVNEYRNYLVTEAVEDVMKLYNQSLLNKREVKLIIADAIRKSIQV